MKYICSQYEYDTSGPGRNQLFGKLRRELLSLLFRNANSSLYLRELVRLTGASPGAVQREVGLLTRAGLLERSRRGRQVFFQANRAIPVFEDLRGLLDKTMGTVDVLRAALAPLADRIEAAVLFGKGPWISLIEALPHDSRGERPGSVRDSSADVSGSQDCGPHRQIPGCPGVCLRGPVKTPDCRGHL